MENACVSSAVLSESEVCSTTRIIPSSRGAPGVTAGILRTGATALPRVGSSSGSAAEHATNPAPSRLFASITTSNVASPTGVSSRESRAAAGYGHSDDHSGVHPVLSQTGSPDSPGSTSQRTSGFSLRSAFASRLLPTASRASRSVSIIPIISTCLQAVILSSSISLTT